jgi:hypothetical protein
MQITLSDRSLVSDLLSFLRSNGCIAYLTGDLDAIETIRPHSFGRQEEDELRLLVDRWHVDHPDAQFQFE